MRRTATLLAALITGAALLPAPAQADSPREWREVFSPDGSITRMAPPVQPSSSAGAASVGHTTVTPVQVTGPSSERIDLVFVGDGYTAADLGLYHQHVVSKWEELAAVEPFRSYRNLFNVWQVNVVSAESGVDNDPAVGVLRDTALDMNFWCAGIERLLCANEGKANSYATRAPAADQVLALANTTKYGGAGGRIATAAGGNALAGQIAIHELGHSLGGLADEYEYGGPETYGSNEPSEVNVTVDPTGAAKWSRWLGEQSPDGGVVGAYEGGRYSVRGIYRPTSNSIMRSLGRQFNLPGREAMIMAFYQKAPLLKPNAEGAVTGTSTVDLGLPYQLDVRWYLDGTEVAAWAGRSAVTLNLTGSHKLRAVVTDTTTAVRDEAFRAKHMTAERAWTVSSAGQ
ncbi:M64 family metallopeptidase [Longispora albida]|uniref:M64 family metallopeptidase n=1 Tax=Longispora albida TaxID=203523 RepID=UPI00037AC10B|nr:M64 family metallopeptidase [Longispora albida]